MKLQVLRTINKFATLDANLMGLNKVFTRSCEGNRFLIGSQDNLQDQMNKLKRLANERRSNLEHSGNVHAYIRESGDLEEWINEQMQTATSEEYGQDYEHLQVRGGNCVKKLISFPRFSS